MFKKHQKNPTDRYRHVENRRLLAVIYSFLRLSVILVIVALACAGMIIGGMAAAGMLS